MKQIFIFIVFFNSFLFSSDTFFYKNGKKISLEPIENISTNSRSSIDNTADIKYYKTSNNVVLGVRDDIMLELKNGYIISNYLSKYNLKIKKQFNDYLYIVEKINIEDSTLDISNLLSLEEGIQSANPNFIKTLKKR